MMTPRLRTRAPPFRNLGCPMPSAMPSRRKAMVDKGRVTRRLISIQQSAWGS